MFERSGTSWIEQAKLTASDAAAGDQFGKSVSVSGDTAVVGANGDDDAGEGSGSAYVFERSGTSWIEQAKLTASDAAASDFFGISVSVSGDTAVVGANGDDDAGGGSGSAYVFASNVGGPGNWGQQAKLIASDAAAGDQFGLSVSVSGDTAVVGAFLDVDAGVNSGSAYVFEVQPTHSLIQDSIDTINGKLDANLDVAVSTRATQTSVDAIEGKLDALDLSNLDAAVSTRASQTSVDAIEGKLDALDLSNLDAAVSTRATQTSVDAIEGKLDALDLSNLDAAVSSRATQTSVDAIESKLDAFNLTNLDNLDNLDATVSSRATQTSVDAIEGKLDALDLSNLDAAASTRATQTSVDAIESKLDAFNLTNLDNLDATVSSRATQISVDAIEGKLDALDLGNLDAAVSTRATQTSVDAIESKLDAFNLTNLDATVSSRATQTSLDALDFRIQAVEASLNSRIEALASIRLQVVEVKKRERFLLTATLSGARVDVSLVSILALEMKSTKAAEVEDITATVVVNPLATGMLDISVKLPNSMKSANVFVFDVVDSDGHAGTVVFSKLESDDD